MWVRMPVEGKKGAGAGRQAERDPEASAERGTRKRGAGERKKEEGTVGKRDFNSRDRKRESLARKNGPQGGRKPGASRPETGRRWALPAVVHKPAHKERVNRAIDRACYELA